MWPGTGVGMQRVVPLLNICRGSAKHPQRPTCFRVSLQGHAVDGGWKLQVGPKGKSLGPEGRGGPAIKGDVALLTRCFWFHYLLLHALPLSLSTIYHKVTPHQVHTAMPGL